MGSENDSKNKCHLFIEGLSPKCAALIATAIAENLSEGLDPLQIGALGSFISTIASMMGYIATQKDIKIHAIKDDETIDLSIPLI